MDGHTDLTDLYRDRLTLRQVWWRIAALPAEAHLWNVLRADQEKAETAQREAEIENVLAQFQPPKEG